MSIQLTRKEAIKYLESLEGTQQDFDHWYGYQCFDLVNTYWHKLTGERLKGEGAKDIPFKNDFKGQAHVYQNTEDFKAKEGDIFVFSGAYGQGEGHTGIVIKGDVYGDLNYFESLDQNWNGGGWTEGPAQGGTGWEKATRIVHAYDFPMWFIRPIYKSHSTKNSQSPTRTHKKTKRKKKKLSKMKLSQERIQGIRMKKRGYKPKAFVIHNDAGSASAKDYEEALVNANEQRLENGIAHAYADKGYVWEGISEDRVAWHTGDGTGKGTGNHEAYGIEVTQSMSASDKAFLKNEQAVFRFVAQKMKKLNMKPTRNTIRLHMEYASTSCPHRSMYLHTGFDPNKQGRPPKKIMLQLKDYFIKQIRAYMKGHIPVAKVSLHHPSSSNTRKTTAGSWKSNRYHTFYIDEKASFTNGDQPIITRKTGPFRSCTQSGILNPGITIHYDSVMLQDYHVWVSYMGNGGYRIYVPIRTWNGVAPPHHSVGPLWGTIE